MDVTLFGPSDGTDSIVNWETANDFCKEHELVLASYEDYCTKGKTVYGGKKKGDIWVPFSDYSDAWLQMGDSYTECEKHKGVPSWGTDLVKQAYEAPYVLCKPE